MIGLTLKKFSGVLLLISLTAFFLLLYFMANDLSTLNVTFKVEDLQVDGDGVHFHLELEFSYDGSRDIKDFQVKLMINDEEFQSQAVDLGKGTLIIVFPCSVDLDYIGKNLTASIGFSASYAGLIPLSVNLPARSLLRIDVLTPATSLSILSFNESHVKVSFTILPLADIKLSGIAVLSSKNVEVARTRIPPLQRRHAFILTWYVKSEDLEKIDSVEIYLLAPSGYIKIYCWRLIHD